MILVVGSIVVGEGHLEKALSLSHEHVQRSRSEPGCLEHGVHQDAENPQRLVFVEKWSDQEALAQHFKVSASIAFVRDLGQLSAEPPKIEIFQADLVPM